MNTVFKLLIILFFTGQAYSQDFPTDFGKDYHTFELNKTMFSDGEVHYMGFLIDFSYSKKNGLKIFEFGQYLSRYDGHHDAYGKNVPDPIQKGEIADQEQKKLTKKNLIEMGYSGSNITFNEVPFPWLLDKALTFTVEGNSIKKYRPEQTIIDKESWEKHQDSFNKKVESMKGDHIIIKPNGLDGAREIEVLKKSELDSFLKEKFSLPPSGKPTVAADGEFGGYTLIGNNTTWIIQEYLPGDAKDFNGKIKYHWGSKEVEQIEKKQTSPTGRLLMKFYIYNNNVHIFPLTAYWKIPTDVKGNNFHTLFGAKLSKEEYKMIWNETKIAMEKLLKPILREKSSISLIKNFKKLPIHEQSAISRLVNEKGNINSQARQYFNLSYEQEEEKKETYLKMKKSYHQSVCRGIFSTPLL